MRPSTPRWRAEEHEDSTSGNQNCANRLPAIDLVGTEATNGDVDSDRKHGGRSRIEAPFSVIFEQCSDGNKRPDEARFNLNHADISQ
jgi:hypothetical protein